MNWYTLYIKEPFTLKERKKIRHFAFVECEAASKGNIESDPIEPRSTGGLTYEGYLGYDSWLGKIMEFDPEYTFTKANLTEKGFDTCMRALEDMPLLINDKDPYVRAVAKWRLSIGK